MEEVFNLPREAIENILGIDRIAKSKLLKREAIESGYIHQISFYGVLTNIYTLVKDYRRIDLLSNVPFTQTLFSRLHSYFSIEKPKHRYNIYVYDGDDDTIGVFDSYG